MTTDNPSAAGQPDGGVRPVSALIEEHGMTLRDGAMVCKAGDWPMDPAPMPDTEDMVSSERMEYALDRIVGHREHLASVVDAEVAARLAAQATTTAADASATAWNDSDRRDVRNWLIREADQRLNCFPQRRDGVDALIRHLASLARVEAGSDRG